MLTRTQEVVLWTLVGLLLLTLATSVSIRPADEEPTADDEPAGYNEPAPPGCDPAFDSCWTP